jgi:predicted ArsR family transcriptional regulator
MTAIHDEFMTSDLQVLDRLRDRGAMTVSELAVDLEVTATAVRQRLTRLLAQQYIERQATRKGRGRPKHHYRLTEKGLQKAGTNFADLAVALWQEVRQIDNVEVRKGLLQRVAKRLAVLYAGKIDGKTLEDKLSALTELFAERRLPLHVERSQELPVMQAVACPYPDLADRDRSICAMERMLFAELLGTDVRLAGCRLEGEPVCTFQFTQLV